MKRIALYGGTFDPVHIGHVAVAQALSKLFALDEVLFIPAARAPHKRISPVTPALHRYAMLALATQNEPHLRVSTVELDAPEKPYTFETLARMREILGSEAQLFFVMGADSWMEITTWREWERVLALSNHIVVVRPGYELSAEHVQPAIREKINDLRDANKELTLHWKVRKQQGQILGADSVNLGEIKNEATDRVGRPRPRWAPLR